MDERRIEKETRQVLFELSDGSEISGEVFLRLYEAHHAGLQKLGGLLNEKKPFIPIKTKEGVFLINRSHIVLGKANVESEKDDFMALGEKYAVRVKMAKGKEVQGNIFVNLSAGANRVKDYFNQSIEFLPLIQPECVVYLNQQFILSVQD